MAVIDLRWPGQDNGHARLGCSNDRWPHCAGSVQMEAPYPDESGAAAIDGTGTHFLLELCLVNGVRAEHFDMQIIGEGHPDKPGGWHIDLDRIKRVNECLDYLDRRLGELKAEMPMVEFEVLPEHRADPGDIFGRTDWWGTADISIVGHAAGLVCYVEIIDYKDGQGYVKPLSKGNVYHYNTQLLAYWAGRAKDRISYSVNGHLVGLADLKDWNIRKGRITIVQPKTNPSVRYQDLDMAVANEDLIKLARAADATDAKDAPLVPGDHCKWCKHKSACAARTGQALAPVEAIMTNEVQAGSLFEMISGGAADPATLSNEQIEQFLDAAPVISDVIKKMEQEAERRISAGQTVNGYSIQPGRATRKWNLGEEELVRRLKAKRLTLDDIYERKLRSPAQLEQLEKMTDKKRANLQELISTVAGKDKLKRVAKVERSAAEMFANLPAEEPAPNFLDATEQPAAEAAPLSFI